MGKTIRINKKHFFILAFLAPMFASYFAVFSFLSIYQAINKNSSQSTTIEVPVLGDVETAQETPAEGTVAEQSKQSSQPENVEVITVVNPDVTPESAASTVKQSQGISSTKSTNYSTKSTTNTSTKPTTNTTTNSTTSNEKTEKTSKQLCEERTDGPTTFIKVRLLPFYERETLILFGNYENPVVEYSKYVVKDGAKAKMVYTNNSCVPSETNLEVVDDEIIVEETDLPKYGIEAKTYTKWL